LRTSVVKPNHAPLARSLLFCSLFQELLAAQFSLIFREIACSLLTSDLLQPAPERVLSEEAPTTIFADPETAPMPRFDVKRPPFKPGFVPEVLHGPPNVVVQRKQMQIRSRAVDRYRELV
jgi:hypothetical protein